jgi:hypothetical protein
MTWQSSCTSEATSAIESLVQEPVAAALLEAYYRPSGRFAGSSFEAIGDNDRVLLRPGSDATGERYLSRSGAGPPASEKGRVGQRGPDGSSLIRRESTRSRASA